jgi:acetyl-CoA carboxylase carboxyltransferase component
MDATGLLPGPLPSLINLLRGAENLGTNENKNKILEVAMTLKGKIDEFKEKEKIARLGGGTNQIEKQHKLGKLAARERIELLLDPDTFLEVGMFVTHRCSDFGMDQRRIWGDGVVTGSGRIEGRTVHLYSQDFTVLGGSLGEYHAKKIGDVMDAAVERGTPIIGLGDSGGARIHEGPPHAATLLYRNYLASGVVPQIAVVLGPCSGGAAISASMADFVFVVEGIGYMFTSGPGVVKALTGEEVTNEELGGAKIHAEKSGVAHFITASEEDCFKKVRTLLSYLPSNFEENPPRLIPTDKPIREVAIDSIIADGDKPYDMKSIIRAVLDDDQFLEVQEFFAQNLIIGFGRLDGSTVGIVANQPLVLNGMVDMDAADKSARFIRFCDAFNIPLVNFIDCPGYFAGKEQEHRGLIRHAAKMLYAYGEVTVPRIAIAVRNVYGAGISGMGMSKAFGTDLTIAFPFAEFAAMKPEAAANVIFKDEIAKSADPKETRNKRIQEFREKFANPYVAAERGWLDMLIDPKVTRQVLIKALDTLKNKVRTSPRRRHGTIPL